MAGAAAFVSKALGWIGSRGTGAAMLGGGVLATQGYFSSGSGDRSWFSEITGWGGEEFAAAGARGAAEGTWMGIYAFLERLGEFLQSVSGGEFGAGLTNYAREMQGLSVDADNVNNTLSTEGMNATLLEAQQGDITTSVGNTINAAGIGITGGFGQIAGHVADLGDWASGNVLSWVGVDTGFEDRDLSNSWMHAARNGYANTMDAVGIGAPDLRGDWARAADWVGHGASYAATLVAGGWAVGLKSIFAAATSPTANAATIAMTAATPRSSMTQQQIVHAIS